MNYHPFHEPLKREFYYKNERNKKFYIFHISFKVEDTIHQKTFITVNVTISHKICKSKLNPAISCNEFLFYFACSSKIKEKWDQKEKGGPDFIYVYHYQESSQEILIRKSQLNILAAKDHV